MLELPDVEVFRQPVNATSLQGVSFLRLALYCTVLGSRWCQSGVRRTGEPDLCHQSTEFTMPAQRISAAPKSLSPVLTVMEVRTIPDSVA
jgi:hypothetical protein